MSAELAGIPPGSLFCFFVFFLVSDGTVYGGRSFKFFSINAKKVVKRRERLRNFGAPVTVRVGFGGCCHWRFMRPSL